MDQIQQALDDARNAGDALEAQMAREASIEVANIKVQYEQMLNETIDHLDSTIKSDLDQLSSEYGTNEQKTNSDLQKGLDKLGVDIRALPFRSHQPQLIRSAPASIVPELSTHTVRISFEGNFEDVNLSGYKPTLQLKDAKPGALSPFTLIRDGQTVLTFEGPLSAFFSHSSTASSASNFGGPSSANLVNSFSAPLQDSLRQLETSLRGVITARPQKIVADGCGNFLCRISKGIPGLVDYFPAPSLETPTSMCPLPIVAGEQNTPDPAVVATAHQDLYQGESTRLILSIPWRQSKFLGIVHKKNVSHYDLIVDRLPISPGKLTLVYTTVAQRERVKLFHSAGYHQASTREAGNEDHKDVPYPVTPEVGWHVIRNTSSFNIGSQQGTWSYTFQGDDGDQVRYDVTTIHKSAGSSGSVDFSISFMETQPQDCSTEHYKIYPLAWGDSVAIDPAAAKSKWLLTFAGFDGSRQQFAGSDLTNPYIQIVNEQGTFIIKTASPSEISWPPMPK
jgi:hypothetical protein